MDETLHNAGETLSLSSASFSSLFDYILLLLPASHHDDGYSAWGKSFVNLWTFLWWPLVTITITLLIYSIVTWWLSQTTPYYSTPPTPYDAIRRNKRHHMQNQQLYRYYGASHSSGSSDLPITCPTGPHRRAAACEDTIATTCPISPDIDDDSDAESSEESHKHPHHAQASTPSASSQDVLQSLQFTRQPSFDSTQFITGLLPPSTNSVDQVISAVMYFDKLPEAKQLMHLIDSHLIKYDRLGAVPVCRPSSRSTAVEWLLSLTGANVASTSNNNNDDDDEDLHNNMADDLDHKCCPKHDAIDLLKVPVNPKDHLFFHTVDHDLQCQELVSQLKESPFYYGSTIPKWDMHLIWNNGQQINTARGPSGHDATTATATQTSGSGSGSGSSVDYCTKLLHPHHILPQIHNRHPYTPFYTPNTFQHVAGTGSHVIIIRFSHVIGDGLALSTLFTQITTTADHQPAFNSSPHVSPEYKLTPTPSPEAISPLSFHSDEVAPALAIPKSRSLLKPDLSAIDHDEKDDEQYSPPESEKSSHSDRSSSSSSSTTHSVHPLPLPSPQQSQSKSHALSQRRESSEEQRPATTENVEQSVQPHKRKLAKPSILKQIYYLLYSLVMSVYNNFLLMDTSTPFTSFRRSPQTLVYNHVHEVVNVQPFYLDIIQNIKDTSGCTVNDVFLCLISGAFRKYCAHLNDLRNAHIDSHHTGDKDKDNGIVHHQRGTPSEQTRKILSMMKSNYDLDQLSVRALMTIALPRQVKKKSTETIEEFYYNQLLCNKSTAATISLSSNIMDSKRRLNAIFQSTSYLKQSLEIVLNRFSRDFIRKYISYDILTRSIRQVFGRHSMLISNVPGPKESAFLCGQQIKALTIAYSSLVIPFIGVLTYDNITYMTLNIDTGKMPDIHLFSKFIIEELQQLCRIYQVQYREYIPQ